MSNDRNPQTAPAASESATGTGTTRSRVDETETTAGRSETRDERALRQAAEAYQQIVAARPGLRPSHIAYLIERQGINADAARLVVPDDADAGAVARHHRPP